MAAGILPAVLEDRYQPAPERALGDHVEPHGPHRGQGDGAWGDPGAHARNERDGEGLARERRPATSQARNGETSRRLGRPSESGRLPLPEELGIAREELPPVTELTDEAFAREVRGTEVPVLVDFWAETCVPCRLQEPTIRRLARDLAGRVRVARLNVFDHPRTPDALRIKGVPHLVVFLGGEVVMELVGSHSYEQLREKLRQHGLD